MGHWRRVEGVFITHCGTVSTKKKKKLCYQFNETMPERFTNYTQYPDGTYVYIPPAPPKRITKECTVVSSIILKHQKLTHTQI